MSLGKTVRKMKRIITACLEQTIKFESSEEFEAFKEQLTRKGTCGRLNISHCAGEKCKFLNREANHTDINVWSSRLSLLSEEEQMKIARKYYGGKRPWKDGGGDTL